MKKNISAFELECDGPDCDKKQIVLNKQDSDGWSQVFVRGEIPDTNQIAFENVQTCYTITFELDRKVFCCPMCFVKYIASKVGVVLEKQ